MRERSRKVNAQIMQNVGIALFRLIRVGYMIEEKRREWHPGALPLSQLALVKRRFGR